MGEILFLSHRIPFPPDRGDKIRSHHVLHRLAEIAPVHVATLADDAFDLAQEDSLARLAASYRLVRREKPLPLAGIQAIMTGRPVSLAAFHSAALQSYVDSVLKQRPIDAIYVFSGQMGQYVPKAFGGSLIVDLVDVDSAKFDAYASTKSGPRGWIDAREGRVLHAEEARLAGRADALLLISEAERDLFAARLGDDERAKRALRVMPNGIDSALFDPAAVRSEAGFAEIAGSKIVFTGQMDYAPNIQAALRAADRIMPLVRRACPDATFHVIGRNPPAALTSRHGRDGCFVWGRVEDMREWLAGADLALVPLEIARGVQNKVLEAMAMALPVVLSSGAATGIGARDGEHFRVADSDGDLADAAISLLKSPESGREMGAAARKFVVEHSGWEAALAPLAGWMGFPGGAIRDAA